MNNGIGSKESSSVGIKHSLAEQVLEIKNRIAKGEQKTGLATEFGVSRQTIYTVIEEYRVSRLNTLSPPY